MRTAEELDRFESTDALNEAKSFFLVGIGGAGMSGLARMLNHRGHKVRGTDSTDSPLIQQMITEGIEVFIGHTGEPIQAGDAVILSDAIDLSISPEVKRAIELGCGIFRRSQGLAWVLRGRKTIAVTGTHGKTTTTGMIAAGLRAAGMDPLVVVGAEVPEFGSAIVEGKGEYAVVEACEAYESYRDLEPYISVLTNLELDHIDYHKSYDRLLASMRRFLNKTSEDGGIVISSDPGAQEAAEELARKRADYNGSTFVSLSGGTKPVIPGSHIELNAGGALQACIMAGADPALAAKGIASFRGAERRLQILRDGDIKVVDDYAHHPTEIAASLQAIREGNPGRRLIVVFQPHLYSRTEPLINEFAAALSSADVVVLTDIYPARENPIPGVSSLRIAEKVTKPVHYVPLRHLLPRFVRKISQSGDVVIGMGAGSIGEFTPAFINELDRPSKPKVAVIYGGESPEREVSLNSGRAVKAAVDRLGYDGIMIDCSEKLLGSGEIKQLIGKDRPDLAILAIHGTGAEDGALQGFLNLIHIPFSGCDVMASSIAMDKEMTKKILASQGLPVPGGIKVRKGDPLENLPKFPVVVKPNNQGSTVGLYFVDKHEDLQTAVDKAFMYADEVLIEEQIFGTEISVPVFGDKAMPPVEVVPASGVYDFASKYVIGATEEICPARILEDKMALAKEYALRSHQALGCSGITRTDMIVEANRIVILEVNTLPGMTPTSLVPKSADSVGMSFDQVVEWMIQDAQKARR